MKYSDKNQPPAPIAKVILRNIETSESVSNVPMLLDTGSDITLLPKSFCEEIGVEISDTEFLELEGFNNATSLAFYVRLEFIFLNKMFRGKFLVYESDEGLIGRDILNEFSIVFDGKSLSWFELE